MPYSKGGTIMHDIDRTMFEFEPEEGLEAGDFEFDAGELGDQMESPFSETEEMELASQLLEIQDEAELDQFLGSLFKKIGRGIRRVAGPLGGFLKKAAKIALPLAGKAAGTFFGGPVGGMIGGKLGSVAGKMFGLELEGLSQEDQEFEVARRFVRLAGDAAQKAAAMPITVPPQQAAKTAVIEAAKKHAPGLLTKTGEAGAGGYQRRSGRWIRRGSRIVLHGVYY
jgi:hypothetical protein